MRVLGLCRPAVLICSLVLVAIHFISSASATRSSFSPSGVLSSGEWRHEDVTRATSRLMRFAGAHSPAVDENDGLATLSTTAHYATLPTTITSAEAEKYCTQLGYHQCTFKDICPQGEGSEPVGANELPNQKVFVPIAGIASQKTNMYVAATAQAGDGVCTRHTNPAFGTQRSKAEAGTSKSLVPCCSTQALQAKGFPSGVLKTIRVSNSLADRLRNKDGSARRRRARRRRARELARKKAEEERLRAEELARKRGKSCKDIKDRHPKSADGLYHIDLQADGKFVDMYCDMTTDGGGWTLLSYSHRPQTVHPHSSDVSFLPDKAQGEWNPVKRNNVAAVDGSQLFRAASHVLLTNNDGGEVVDGNALSYRSAWKWSKPGSYHHFSLSGNTGCAHIHVTELKSGSTFGAYTFVDRAQVSCSGHSGGTQFERQLLGFNANGCHGVCGSDPSNSGGLLVHRGDGYTPTTSGGQGNPLRAASMGFWVR